MPDVRETLHMDAPAELVYDLVADLPRMGEWSTGVRAGGVARRGDQGRARVPGSSDTTAQARSAG
jgi:uncharacterized membrane protein